MSNVAQESPLPRTAPAVADPAPLGLAAFALTTFLLSAQNAEWTDGTLGGAWLAFAVAYGGLGQFMAGMWEFRRGNVFWATAFSTYGAFWIGLALHSILTTRGLILTRGATALQVTNDLGWILLAFAIFNTYMLLWSTQVNEAVLAVFLTLEATEIILCIGFFADNTTTIKVGGYVGVVTAACAWYASAAGVINGMLGRSLLAVGGPLMKPPALGQPAGRATPHAH